MVEVKFEVDDRLNEKDIKSVLCEVDKRIKWKVEAKVIEEPIEEFLKLKYPDLKEVSYSNYKGRGTVEVEFNIKGKQEALDLLNRVHSNGLFLESLEFRQFEYDADCYGYREGFKVVFDGISGVEDLKPLFIKELV